MGILKVTEEKLNKKTSIIKEVLNYFSSKESEISRDTVQQIAAAADNAYTDTILFEEFENWVSDKDDETFLHLISHYWDSRSKPKLDSENQDLTNNKSEIEKIKKAAKEEQARAFGDYLKILISGKGLKTLEEIGAFLGVSSERARVMLEGKHKPQRKTIINVAEKFEIDPEEIYQRVL